MAWCADCHVKSRRNKNNNFTSDKLFHTSSTCHIVTAVLVFFEEKTIRFLKIK